jgi:hypothetical protein
MPGCSKSSEPNQSTSSSGAGSQSASPVSQTTIGCPTPPPGKKVDWGSESSSKGNCYRYACDDPKKPGEDHSPFPGGADPGRHITCKDIMDGARKQGAKDPDSSGCCAKGWRKIAGVVQDKSHPGADNDYHWYRQEPDGTWSHKRGATGGFKSGRFRQSHHRSAKGRPEVPWKRRL